MRMFSAKNLRRFGCVIALALPISVVSRMEASASEVPPQTVVESFHQALLETMKKARSLGPKGRFIELEPVIARAFDMRHITESAVGSDWGKLSSEQQSKLATAFERFEVAQFADLFDSYDGQRFRSLGVKPVGDGLVVATIMEGKGLPAVRFDYTIHRDADSWKIEDIRFDAWLRVVERRSAELRDILHRRGFNALISSLDQHTQAVLDRPDAEGVSHLADLRPDAHPPYPLPLPLR